VWSRWREAAGVGRGGSDEEGSAFGGAGGRDGWSGVVSPWPLDDDGVRIRYETSWGSVVIGPRAQTSRGPNVHCNEFG